MGAGRPGKSSLAGLAFGRSFYGIALSHALSVAANFTRLPDTIVNPGCMYTS